MHPNCARFCQTLIIGSLVIQKVEIVDYRSSDWLPLFRFLLFPALKCERTLMALTIDWWKTDDRDNFFLSPQPAFHQSALCCMSAVVCMRFGLILRYLFSGFHSTCFFDPFYPWSDESCKRSLVKFTSHAWKIIGRTHEMVRKSIFQVQMYIAVFPSVDFAWSPI